ncbi:MAG TPA: FtsX-like permease family protein, partial [Terriglobales bacterium]|nr:FtsX-like permease family protein [Terriglobales bacterium]
RQYFGGEDPIGKYVALDSTKGVPNWRQVVGIIADVRQESLDKAPYAEMLLPYAQSPRTSMDIVIRTSARPETLIAAARNEVHALDSNLPVYNIHTLNEVTALSLSDRSFQTWLLGSFAGLALLLAAIGIYGVMAQAVAQRTSEFGIRMALGAQPRQILSMVLGNALRLVAIGVAAGLAASLILTRFLRSFLYGVSANDPLTIAAVSALLVGVALLACYLPARRAMGVDPMVALRYE